MKVRFLLGRAGSGKTAKCLEEICSSLSESPYGHALILLVPEQATYQMDRALLAKAPRRGYTRACVLSFRWLAYRVLREVGGAEKPIISELGRLMRLRALLSRNADKLELFKGEVVKPGLVEHLSQTVHEMRQYCVTPEELQRAFESVMSEDPNSILALKLHDLLLLYNQFLDWCRESVLDEDDLPELLKSAISESKWLDGARLWVDGFSGFTKQEYEVLKALLTKASEVTFSLTLDPTQLSSLPKHPTEVEPTRLFAITEETYLRLQLILPPGAEVQTETLPPEGSPLPRFRNPELAYIERTMFDPAPRPPTHLLTHSPTHLTLIEAGNRRAEVDAAAKEILRLVREEGYRYRDIAVILRDIETYHQFIEATFGDYGIPYFIDRRRPTSHHPLVELLRSALKVVCEHWSSEAVVQYLKTDLVPVQRQTVDELENYALAHGIHGSLWYADEDWRFRKRLMMGEDSEGTESEETFAQRLNKQRREAVQALRAFEQRLQASTGYPSALRVCDVAQAVYQLLCDIEVAKTLDRWRRLAEEAGDLDRANEQEQVWNDVIELLDELVDALGDETCSLDDFTEILESALASLELGLIPPSLDQVLVGSIERSRHPEIKAAFVLGLTEGLFPKVSDENPILNDSERTRLLRSNVELAPTSEQQFYNENYFGYIAFTRASERLWASYPIADEQGRPLNPSPFVDRLLLCFEDLKPQRIGTGHEPQSLKQLASPHEFAGALLCQLSSSKTAEQLPSWLALYNEALKLPSLREHLAKALPALAYKNEAHLSPDIADKLYGETLSGSVSRLESFAACPFQHFARYGLGLREREEFRLEAVDLGQFYHAVLKRFFERTKETDWANLPLPNAERIIDDAVDELARNLKDEILMTGARNQYIREQSRRALKAFVAALLEQAKVSRFRPAAAELGFGKEHDSIAALEFDLGDGKRLSLTGRIDRVDVAKVDGKALIRVIDYKSRSSKFRLDEVLYGLSLQLLSYLLVVAEKGREALGIAEPIPAASFLSRILRPLHRSDDPSAAPAPGDPKFFSEYKLRGVFDEEARGQLDATLRQGWSNHYALFVKKDGSIGRRDSCDAVSPNQLQSLLRLIEKHLIDFAQKIMSGQIEVSPYQHKNRTPCEMCELRSVCRFEAAFNSYRVLETLKNTEVLERLPLEVSGSGD